MIEAVMSLVYNADGMRKHGERGGIYRCGFEDVAVESWSPEFPLARALLAAGYDPNEQFSTRWADGRPSMSFGTLGEAAKWTVVEREDGKDIPRIVPYQPFDENAKYRLQAGQLQAADLE